jgi:LacI family transcriptional regulator
MIAASGRRIFIPKKIEYLVDDFARLNQIDCVSMKRKVQNEATVTEVAKRAGVSVGTVSRVLNGHTNITQVNFDRVKKAIAELGYKKCRSAEFLVSRRFGSRVRTGNIGVIYTAGQMWANHPLVAAYTVGIEQACKEKGFHALVEMVDDLSVLPRCVRENKIDGLLLKTTRELPSFLQQLPSELPVVCVGLNDPSANIEQICTDDHGAGWIVAEYLWSQGHRRIAFLCDDSEHPMFLARFHGYESFLRSRRGFDPALTAMRESGRGGKTPEEEPPNMDKLLNKVLGASGESVTAIVAANDWMAQGLYSSLVSRNLKPGKDISVVGFDNAVSICAVLRPQLTSVKIPFSDTAYAGAIRLFDRIENSDLSTSHSLHLIRGEIVERGSVRRLE